jgi:transposase
MSKVRNIIRLYTEGVSKKSISVRTGVPRNTVKKYIILYLSSGRSFEDVEQMTDAELEGLFLSMAPCSRIEDDPRYMVLEKLFPEIEKSLKQKENTKDSEWQNYITRYPDGYRVSQFKFHYLKWYKAKNPVMHMEHKAGEKMYVDYAGDKLSFVDPQTGEITPVEVFVSVLGASQLFYVEASMSQQKEDFIGSCERTLHYYGGSPKAIVTDNLKSAVIRSNKYEPTLNEAFRDFVSHYTMAALPAGPYKPKHKALVEGAVKIIYKTIYGPVKEQVYTSLESLNRAIFKALEEHNDKVMKGRTYSRRQVFEETERSTLQPLPARRYELKRKRVVTVMKNNYVCLSEDKHYYSVPYEYIGKKVTLLYSPSEVEVYHHYTRIAVHARDRRPFGYTTIEEHLASRHRYISDWNPEKFIARAEEIGKETSDYITKLLESRQHPEQAYKSCQGVLSFAARAGKERLNNACKRALHYGDYSYQTIRVILERGLDKPDLQEESEDVPIPRHGNIRGKVYYN